MFIILFSGKNGNGPRRSPSKCGQDTLKARPVPSNVSTFIPQPHSPKSNGRLAPHSSSPQCLPAQGSPAQCSPANAAGSSNGGTLPNNGGPKLKKSRSNAARPPSSTYQNLKDMAMYVDDEIDADISCVESGSAAPNSIVGVGTDLCYTDDQDVRHSVV